MAGREAEARWQAAALERQLLSAEAKSLETEASLTAATMQAAGKLSSLFNSGLFDQKTCVEPVESMQKACFQLLHGCCNCILFFGTLI